MTREGPRCWYNALEDKSQAFLRGTSWSELCWTHNTRLEPGPFMHETKPNLEHTSAEENGRDQVRRLMDASGEPAPVDVTQFLRRTGQIIARATASSSRDQP